MKLNNKGLAVKLAITDNEADVVQMLRDLGYWDDISHWRNYGDNENNYSIVGNQQSRPDAALREQIINAVDACLMRAALEAGINPEGSEAPQSVREALVSLFGIYDGKLSNITKNERTKLAKDIVVMATGSKSAPCYTVIDKGEGQSPGRMPDTLLSLSKSNKLKIPFVQGKFNMGRTGAFPYCGKERMQLVISKRCPAISEGKDGDRRDEWGFTVIRRVHPRDGMRSSAYMYLAPGGKILSFKSKSLPLLPGKYPKAYENPIVFGTFVKHYNYQIGNSLRTNILFDLYNRLSLLIPKIALPVRLIERRVGYKGHSMETNLNGLSVRLEEDRRDNLENGFPCSASVRLDDEVMPATIYAFNRKQSGKYKNNEGIVFTINGQTQGDLATHFYRRKSVGMSYLADSILIDVDCSGLPIAKHEDLFMNSRDRLREGKLLSSIERELTLLVNSHPGLKELRERRRREDIENKLGDSKPLADIIGEILKSSPSLAHLFKIGKQLPNPFKIRSTKNGQTYNGEWFPTRFKLVKQYPQGKPRSIAINRRMRIQFSTDACNDYFTRDKEPGEFSLMINGESYPFTMNLWNGHGNLNIELPHGISEGDMLHFTSSVMDISRNEPFRDEFFAVVGPPEKKSKGDDGNRKKQGDKKGKDSSNNELMSLPKVYEVRSDEWEQHDFSAGSGLKAMYNGETWDFWVNMDNAYLKHELKINRGLSVKMLEARYKYGLTLFALSLIKDDTDTGADGDDRNNIEKLILSATNSLSSVLLPMIASLGELDINEEKESTVAPGRETNATMEETILMEN